MDKYALRTTNIGVQHGTPIRYIEPDELTVAFYQAIVTVPVFPLKTGWEEGIESQREEVFPRELTATWEFGRAVRISLTTVAKPPVEIGLTTVGEATRIDYELTIVHGFNSHILSEAVMYHELLGSVIKAQARIQSLLDSNAVLVIGEPVSITEPMRDA